LPQIGLIVIFKHVLKATVIDDTSWAEVIIKYVLEYIDQHPIPGLDN